MSLTPDDVKRIAEDILDMNPKDHADDHRWTAAKRLDEDEWRKFRQKVIGSTIFSAIWIVIGWTAVALWHELTAKLAAILNLK